MFDCTGNNSGQFASRCQATRANDIGENQYDLGWGPRMPSAYPALDPGLEAYVPHPDESSDFEEFVLATACLEEMQAEDDQLDDQFTRMAKRHNVADDDPRDGFGDWIFSGHTSEGLLAHIQFGVSVQEELPLHHEVHPMEHALLSVGTSKAVGVGRTVF